MRAARRRSSGARATPPAAGERGRTEPCTHTQTLTQTLTLTLTPTLTLTLTLTQTLALALTLTLTLEPRGRPKWRRGRRGCRGARRPAGGGGLNHQGEADAHYLAHYTVILLLSRVTIGLLLKAALKTKAVRVYILLVTSKFGCAHVPASFGGSIQGISIMVYSTKKGPQNARPRVPTTVATPVTIFTLYVSVCTYVSKGEQNNIVAFCSCGTHVE